jgi:hypothetical protein
VAIVAILLQLVQAPPVPPPPADSLAAAVALWLDHPPSEERKQAAIDTAVATAAYEALAKVGVQPSSNLSVTRRFITKHDQLRPLLARYVPVERGSLDLKIARCAVEQIAYSLSLAEIADVRRFMSTKVGTKFWNAAGLSYWPLDSCYRAALALEASDSDYRSIGLKPPKTPRSSRRGNMTYGWSSKGAKMRLLDSSKPSDIQAALTSL